MESEPKQTITTVTISKRALLVEDYVPCQKIMTLIYSNSVMK